MIEPIQSKQQVASRRTCYGKGPRSNLSTYLPVDVPIPRPIHTVIFLIRFPFYPPKINHVTPWQPVDRFDLSSASCTLFRRFRAACFSSAMKRWSL